MNISDGDDRQVLGIGQTANLLDQMLQESKLYSSSQRYKDLLDFVVRLRNFAPFNALLLNIQKPGLTYAAYAKDWLERFGRTPKSTARPLLILRPFGPVALVFDVMDTEGDPIPNGAFGFYASGNISDLDMIRFYHKLEARGIRIRETDHGGNKAGKIQSFRIETPGSTSFEYEIQINRNHDAPTRFATMTHELAHLFLGHLGANPELKISDRLNLSTDIKEIEAESVSYLVCRRVGVEPYSSNYLSAYFQGESKVTDLALHEIMNVTGRIESVLNLDGMRRLEESHQKIPNLNNLEGQQQDRAQFGLEKINHADLEHYQRTQLLRYSQIWFEQCRIRYLHSAQLLGYKSEIIEDVGRARNWATVNFSPLFKPLQILFQKYNTAYYTPQIGFFDSQKDAQIWEKYFRMEVLPMLLGNLACVKLVLQAVSILPEGKYGESLAWLVTQFEDVELPELRTSDRFIQADDYFDRKQRECLSSSSFGNIVYITPDW